MAYALGGKLVVSGGFVSIGFLIGSAAIVRKLQDIQRGRKAVAHQRKAMQEVASLVSADRRVEAMKLYRELTGANLYEARSAIDEIARSMKVS